MEFQDHAVQEQYDRLPDLRRWQITNLLAEGHSPRLWFYVQKRDSARPIKSESQLTEEFLVTPFVKTKTERITHVKSSDGTYRPTRATMFPNSPTDALIKIILTNHNDGDPIRHTLERLGVAARFFTLNKIRTWMTTTQFPFLQAAKAP
jgi:hypothetical protein